MGNKWCHAKMGNFRNACRIKSMYFCGSEILLPNFSRHPLFWVQRCYFLLCSPRPTKLSLEPEHPRFWSPAWFQFHAINPEYIWKVTIFITNTKIYKIYQRNVRWNELTGWTFWRQLTIHTEQQRHQFCYLIGSYDHQSAAN